MKLPIELSEQSREPIYHQIEQQLIALIVSGQLKPGTMLPSIRKLASELSCSVITTTKAYQNLEQHNYIKTVRGKGTFVADIQLKDKQSVADSQLQQAFRTAIEMSFRMQRSKEQIRELFEQVLEKISSEQGDKEQ
ncbi:GntR family transcriptional regulator [Paenibacillus senegalensis]|uniref:GntR family transcriptional regulator n=1 Tax=Paenibacillus senegalensis TaxID=1465766 RepID=UPI000287B73C|nr:GntR family transcriptional regulator [Paenibacillus senegalensis]